MGDRNIHSDFGAARNFNSLSIRLRSRLAALLHLGTCPFPVREERFAAFNGPLRTIIKIITGHKHHSFLPVRFVITCHSRIKPPTLKRQKSLKTNGILKEYCFILPKLFAAQEKPVLN
jgi:hypothetical protein